MANYCDIVPKITDRQGNEVESKLFKDLLEYFDNDRAATKKHYFAAVHSTFLNSIAGNENVTFDENGEITLHSLIKVANLDPQNIKLIKKLNKDIKSGVYSYAEGLQKARAFNKTEYGDEFLATLVPTENGNYRLEVVERTAQNIASFEEVIAEQETMTLVIDELNNQGVIVDFVDTKEYNGRFSTASPIKTADGMYHLIQISRGTKDMERVLIEEAAHFAVAALRKTTPVKRLLEMCENPEVAKKMNLYTEEEIQMGINENTYETAGRILAMSFAEEHTYGFGGFLNRVKSFIYNLIGKISPNSFAAKRVQIRELAKQIADEYSYGNASIETALEDPITLFAGLRNSSARKTLYKMKEKVHILANKVYNADVQLYHLLKDSDAYNQLEVEDVANVSLSRAAQLSQLMVETLLTEIEGHYNNLIGLEDQKDSMTIDDYKAEKRKQIYILASYVAGLADMYDSIEMLGKEVPNLQNYLITNSLLGATGLKGIISHCEALVYEYIADVAAEFYTQLIGSDRIVLDGKIKELVVKSSRGRDVKVKSVLHGDEIPVGELVRKVFGSTEKGVISLFSLLFQAPHKLDDIAHSYLHMFIRDEDVKIQRRISEEFEPDMFALEKLVKSAGFKSIHDLSECIEEYTDDKGITRRTNFISLYSHSKYEELRSALIKEIVAECKEYIADNPDEFPNRGSKQRFINKSIREDERLLQFEEDVWVVEDDGTKHLNPDYEDGILINRMYESWMREAESNPDSKSAKKIKVIEALTEYKRKVDSLLNKPGGGIYGISYRIPQISTKGTWVREMSYQTKKQLKETGADFIIGTDGISIYRDALSEVEDVFLKLPIYGVRQINEPSTDLLTSLKLYTVMAVRYNELNNALFDLNIVEQALFNRSASETNKKLANNSKTEVLATINKYLFGNSNPYGNDESTLKHILNGIFMTKVLIGNVFSYIKNIISSNFTMLTNSTVSEYYNFYNYIESALAKIGKGVLKPFVKVGNLLGMNTLDKDALILHHINGTYNDTIAWSKYKPKAWLKYIFYQMPLRIYGTGDQFSQETAYLAMLNHFHGYEYKNLKVPANIARGEDIYYISRLLKKGAKKSRLRNIYRFSKDGQEGVFLSNSFLKNIEDVGYYTVLSSFLNDIKEAIRENEEMKASGDPDAVFKVVSDFFNSYSIYTSNIERALEDRGITYRDEMSGMFTVTLEELKDSVEKAINDMLWTEEDLIALSNGLISELVEVQGTYFAGLRAKIQTDAEMEGTAVLFGYGIGAANKFLNSNFNTLTGKYEASMWDAWKFSIMKTFKGVIEDEGGEEFSLRRKSILEFLTIAALNIPGLELLTRNKMAKEVLMKAGYNQQIIRRMHTLGNGLLWWLLFRYIASLFNKKDSEKVVEDLKEGKYKRASSKGDYKEPYDLNEFSYSALERITSVRGAPTSLVFDLICPPPGNAEIAESASASLGNTFGKKNPLTLAITDSHEFKKSALHTLQRYAYMLKDYAELLESNPDVNPEELLRHVADSYGISNESINNLLAVNIPYSIEDHKHGVYVKEGGKISKLSYPQFLKEYGFEDTPNNKELYDELVAKNNDFVKERYYLTNPEDVSIISDFVLASAYNSITYDKDSYEYKLCSILYYLLASSADEVGGMVLPDQFIKQFASNTAYVSKPYLTVLKQVEDILSKPFDDKEYRDEALSNVTKKDISDMFLRLIGMESDANGNIRKPKNFDEMSTGEQEYNTGATFKDHYVRYTQKKNYENK